MNYSKAGWNAIKYVIKSEKKEMVYPVKFREKVMEYLKRGHTQKNTVQTFGISTDTLWNWRNGNGKMEMEKKARRNIKKTSRWTGNEGK
jgi:hypothetical protein